MTSIGKGLLRCLNYFTGGPGGAFLSVRLLETWNKSSRKTTIISSYHRRLCHYSVRSFSTSSVWMGTIAKTSPDVCNLGTELFPSKTFSASKNIMSVTGDSEIETICPTTSVLRYAKGDERFQLKVVLSNGKVFNFERPANDTIQACIDRMVTNISKKVKTFNGHVSFMVGSKSSDLSSSACHVDNSLIVEGLLEDLLTNSEKFLKIQIGEETFDVAVNPPEIYSIKFFKQVDAEFPVIPIKLEASSNFQMNSSKFFWEFAEIESVEPNGISKKANKKRKNSQNLELGSKQDSTPWKSANCNSFLFTPPKELVGHRLRLTCIPSTGLSFGVPFTVEVPTPVTSSVVQNPLFEERLQRILPKPIDDLTFLRVVSYNCLADTYATEEWFISSPKGCLSPDFRMPFISKELVAYNADLYCLQEIDEKFFEGIFSPCLEHNLKSKGYFSCKIGNTKEGIATFYNPQKFDALRHETVVILEHMKTLPFWNSISSLSEEFFNRLNERNTVFQLSILKPKGVPDSIIIIANTHLYFHPDADHIRCLQTLTCVDYIESTLNEIRKAFPTFSVSVIFCGDFNCTPPFSSYRFLTSGRIEEDDFDWTSHATEKILPGIRLEHKLQLRNSHPAEELTNITTCFEGCLDYILYQPEHFELINVYSPPSKATIASIIGVEDEKKVSLPNFHTPSDHLPLISDFRFSNKNCS